MNCFYLFIRKKQIRPQLQFAYVFFCLSWNFTFLFRFFIRIPNEMIGNFYTSHNGSPNDVNNSTTHRLLVLIKSLHIDSVCLYNGSREKKKFAIGYETKLLYGCRLFDISFFWFFFLLHFVF